MPLPLNGAFAVLGYSRPGEVVQSKPKQAMIVRMSPETLDALQDFPNHPPMEFQFGDTPGIYIGDAFFPLVPSAENTPHDLYLRASSATKKTPPFKLHANVIGKLSVQRELAPSVGEKVRESTTEAINQRANRTTIMIGDPQELLGKSTDQTKHKKRKDPAAASSSRTSSLLDKAKSKALASVARTTKNPASSSPLDKLSPDTVQDIRRRLIHFLAPEERLEDDVVRAVGGPSCTPQLRQAVCQILEDVGETVSKTGSKQYRLKLRSWLEVRPHEWNKWTDAVRTRVCRDARLNLKALGKSESDSIWNHFVFRKANSNALPASSSSAANPAGGRETPEPKRGIMSRDHREKMAATNKPSRKSEIMMKDESRSASKYPRGDTPNETPRDISTSSVNARKQPGSGFKSIGSKLSSSVSGDPPSKKLNDMRPPTRDPPSASSQGSTSHPARGPQRGRREESVAESDNERRRLNQSNVSSRFLQRSKQDDYQDSDTERRRQQRTAERERERDRDRDREKPNRVKELKREREEGETSDASTSTLSKRKPRPRDEDSDFQPSRSSQPPKRRKIDTPPVSLPPKPRILPEERVHHRRLSDIESRYHNPVKRESPLPSLPSKRPRSPPPKRPPPPPSVSSQTPSTTSQASGSKGVRPKPALKFRRGSSIYTSSEDEAEGELPQSTRPRSQQTAVPPSPPKSLPPPPPPPPPLPSLAPPSSTVTQSNSNTGRVPSSHRSSRPSSKPYGKDRPSLRVRYSQAYADYMSTMLKLAVQRTKLESMLRDHDHMSAGSITDSEGDELMTPDELALLAAQHKLKHDELDAIKKEFDKMDSSGTCGSSE